MKKETRVAHSDGVTDITLTPDGEKIITCGNDGDVRIWQGFDDDDPITSSASDTCFGIVSHSDKIIVGTENNSVEFFQLPGGKPLGTKLKFTGAANHVDISKDGKVVVAGSADKTIQVLTLDDTSSPPIKIEAHSGPVLAVAIDPLQKFIVSAGCDGDVFIWSFQDPKKSIKRWTNVFPSSNDITTSSTLCRMAWNPENGKQLAIPTKDKITLYERETWNEVQSLKCSKLTKFFSVVRFSNCASYIGAGGFDGTISIWDTVKYTLLVQITEANHITGLSFNYKNDQLFCVDNGGRLICIKDFTGDKVVTEGSTITNSLPSSSTLKTNNDNDKENGDMDDVFDDGMDDLFTGGVGDDDDDDDNSISISKIKAETGWVDDEYVGVSKAKGVLNNGVSNGDDNDDARSVSSLASSKISRIIPPSGPAVNPFTARQKPFQPSSTPEHLQQRFLTWNKIGIMKSCSSQDEELDDDTIDIEFHDANFHPMFQIPNKFEYCIGNMSTEVIALGSRKGPETTSKLFCRVLSSWDSNKDWTVELPRNEEMVGIALGSGWMVAATSEFRLRLFSIGGVQKFIYDLPGSIVALSAHENLLFVTYHGAGPGTDGNQNIFYAIFKVFASSSKISPLILDSPLPLSRKSTLAWMGFTDEGTPVFSDSKNVLRTLHGRLWSPFCQMKEHVAGPNDHFWVVRVSETDSQVLGVKCKGTSFPATWPKPTLMYLEAKLPLCEMDTEKSKLEDAMLQSMWLEQCAKKLEKKGYEVEEFKEKADTTKNKKLFELFIMAIKANCEFRASEYMSMLPTAQAMQFAIRTANKFNRHALTEHLQAIGHRKMDQEGVIEEEEFDDFEFTQVVTHVEHRLHSTNDSGTEFNLQQQKYEQAFNTNGNSKSRSNFGSVVDNNSSSSGSNTSNNNIKPIIIEDNPLLKRQKDKIRSIIGTRTVRSNPFKKGTGQQSQHNNNMETSSITSSSSITRQSSFTFSQNSLMDEDSQKLTNGSNLDTSDDNSNSGLISSRGMSKIDVWTKPKEKKDTLPEFNPKDPNRKSKSSSSGTGKESGGGGKNNKKGNPFEKKNKNSKDLQEKDTNNKQPKQRTLFDMGGKKRISKSNSTINLDDSQDSMSINTEDITSTNNDEDLNMNTNDVQMKKRKRSMENDEDHNDNSNGETEKMAKIAAIEDDD